MPWRGNSDKAEAWLRRGQSLRVSNAPTVFGPVSYRIASSADAREFEVQVTPPSRPGLRHLVVRLRHPEGRAIRLVHVDGQGHRDFDTRQSTVVLRPLAKPIRMTVRYE